MDTVMKPFRRLAAWFLRRELASMERTVREVESRVLQQAVELYRVCKERDELLQIRRRVARMEPWVRQHAPGDTRLLAWAQLLPFMASNGSWTNTSCVHPFDRWGISPKP